MINPMDVTFENYQVKYETVLPLKIRNTLTHVQDQVHRVVAVIDELSQFPELILGASYLGISILSFSPALAPSLSLPKQYYYDARNFTNWFKGVKSVDGLLNFKFFWKSVVLNVSGMTLFIVTTLNLIERLNLLNITAAKVRLAGIPIFGILPWGGLLAFPIVGIMSMITLFALERREKLEQEEYRILKKKLPFWSESLNLSVVQDKQTEFQSKILNLQKEMDAYKALIEEGKQKEDELITQLDEEENLFACQQAIKELTQILDKRQKDVDKYEKKLSQWAQLEKNWNIVDAQELEDFRQAKYTKWEAKLKKIEVEKRAILLSIVNYVITLSRQILVIASVASGYGVFILPFFVNAGLDIVNAGSGITAYLMKRSVKKTHIPSVDSAEHIDLNASESISWKLVE